MIIRSGALVLMAVLAPRIWAQDPPSGKPPQEEYADRLAKIAAAQADRHADLGTFLTSQQMHAWARVEFNNATKLVPNHEKANKGLGFTVWNDEEKKWEVDPNAKIEVQNKKKGEEADRVWTDYQKKIDAMRKDMGKKYYDLGTWCAKSLPAEKDKAEAAFKKAVEFDPLNKDARTKLGHVKQKDGGWLSKEEIASRKELKEGIAKTAKGQVDSAQSDVEEKMGLKMRKQAGEHIMIQSPHLDQKTLEVLLQHGEHAYAMFHKIFSQTNLYGQKQNLTILQNKGQHEKYVDIYGANLPPDYKKQCKEQSIGLGEERFQADQPQSSLEDWVIHQVIMQCSNSLSGPTRHWMHEGLAYYFTKLMHESTATHCFDMRGTSADGGTKDYTDGSTWHIVIKEWIRTGKNEPSIDEVFKATKLSELRGGEPVKAWSLCEFLTTEHREKFVDFMQKVRASKREDDDKVFQEVFGWTLQECNERWRVYARATYFDTK